jgi:hypothetical protein
MPTHHGRAQRLILSARADKGAATAVGFGYKVNDKQDRPRLLLAGHDFDSKAWTAT